MALVLGMMLGIWLPEPIRAADEHGSASEAEGAGHAAAKPRTAFDVTLDLTVWTIVVFLVLLLVLKRAAWKPMLEGLQRREENIRAALEDAKRARDEAQRVRQELQTEMNHAAEKVRDLMDNARRDAERANEEMIAKARNEIQGERDRLRREIDLARDHALQEISNRVAQLATLVSAKAIRRQLSLDDHRRMVDEALAELNNAGTKRQQQMASVRA
jgi:F-type H+-transporting ATPase subunit b